MSTPCGLTREELDAHGFVNENQRCTALFEDGDGNERVCNKLYASHRSSAQGKEQFFLLILFQSRLL